MKTKAQMISADPRMRTPAWRIDSPKKLSTRPEQTRPTTRRPKRPISPKASSQTRGASNQTFIDAPSPDCLQLRVGRQQHRGEDVVEGKDADQRDHYRLVDRATDSGRPTGGRHPFVGADDRDDRAEHRA